MTLEMFSPDLFSSFIEYLDNLRGVIFFMYGFNYFLIESLYVCMGFGLYVNSRMEREGWDLQLLFQGLIPPVV
jgi:hypothetical protein